MTEESSETRDDRWWLLAILVLAAGIRLWGLPSWEWDGDELYTLRDAKDLGATAVHGGAPGIAGRPVYYLLQHLLLKILPETHFFLRLPAFVFGVLGVLATWWVARRVFGRWAGLTAAAMAAISPWHLFASQFARYWTLVYLEAAALFGVLWHAVQEDDRAWYRAGLVILLIGTLTHPTFLFPVVGVAIALYLLGPDGRLGFRWPSRRAWINLWLPFLVLAVGGFIYLKLTGRQQALQNAGSRGLGSTLLVVPGMIQWMSPVVAGAGLIAALYQVQSPDRPGDRRWGLMALLGTASAFAILVAASLKTAVYADYGISALPLTFVCIGGLLQRLRERLEPTSRLVPAVLAILVIGILPSTVSHLIDGTRFDYQPAYEAIRALGPDRPVFGGVDDISRRSLDSVRIIPFNRIQSLDRISGFWFIASQRRYGLREGGRPIQRWIDWHCRRVLATERPRLDYRLYRTELYWCGTDPVPSASR